MGKLLELCTLSVCLEPPYEFSNVNLTQNRLYKTRLLFCFAWYRENIMTFPSWRQIKEV